MPKDVYIARIALLLVPLGLWTVFLTAHLHHLQVGRHEELLAKARTRYTTSATQRRGRGKICDVHGNLLAGNLACRDILAEPWRMESNREAVIGVLARELNVDRRELVERFAKACAPRKRYPTILLHRSVSRELAAEIAEADLPGLLLKDRESSSGSHLTGRIRELVSWSASRSPAGCDVFLDTSRVRTAAVRRECFAEISRWFGRSEAALEALYQESTRNRARPVEIVVQRGVPVQIAKRIQAYREIRIRPAAAGGDLPHVLDILCRELNVQGDTLRKRVLDSEGAAAKARVLLAPAIDGPTVERIQRYRLKGISCEEFMTGLRFVESSRRFYPKGSLLANVIGFTNAAGEGVTGVEELYDEALKPHAGRSSYIRDRVGAKVQARDRDVMAARPGSDVFLTVAEPIQQIVEEELERMVERFTPKAAFSVMINPRTGACMALAQHPSFNPNDRSDLQPGNWTNRIAETGFEPGSVMKPLALSGALDYNVVDLQSEFDCERGRWFFCGESLRDSGHKFDILSVAEILQHSSNIGTAKIALKMGEGRLYQTLRRYGFGQRTGIGFEREAPGIFRSIEEWDGLSISRFPIGQGVLTTPLQMVQAYAALANDGVMMQPYVVDRVLKSDGTVDQTQPRIKRRVVRPPAARRTAEALTLVTTPEGTAPKAAIAGYEVAGKTGTAQKWVNGRYSNNHYVSSFIGFVPARNPAFVLLVTADEPDPEKGYYAGTVAAPAFRRIAERTLRYLDVAPRIDSATAWSNTLSATSEPP